MENLQNGDRFYYLSRDQGLNLLNELENNSFAKMVLNNTDLGETGYASARRHLLGAATIVMLRVRQCERAATTSATGSIRRRTIPYLEAVASMVVSATDAEQATEHVAEYIRVNSNDHVLIQGTNGDDTIIAGGGDDALWGDGGNDRIEAGYGVDKIHGGDGDDIITNSARYRRRRHAARRGGQRRHPRRQRPRS